MQNHDAGELKAAIAEILYVGLLRVRNAGSAGDAALCMIEADHLHNLPALLQNPAEDLLEFYLETERDAYLRQLGDHRAADNHHLDVRAFERSWSVLEQHAHSPTSA